jgi:hypothetical protein
VPQLHVVAIDQLFGSCDGSFVVLADEAVWRPINVARLVHMIQSVIGHSRIRGGMDLLRCTGTGTQHRVQQRK